MARTKQQTTTKKIVNVGKEPRFPIAHKSVPNDKLKKRCKPGVKVLHEIRKYQRSTDNLIPRAVFQRVVREIAQKFFPDIRFQPAAIGALQEAAEAYIINFLEDSNFCAAHAKRVTVLLRDFDLVRLLRRHS